MDTMIMSVSQDVMSSSEQQQRHYNCPTLQQNQRLDYVQAIEEYVLDEHNLNTLQLFGMPLERRVPEAKELHPPFPPPPPSGGHHVRRSAELRTVSIIDTLSELVSRTDNGRHLGGQHDCDGQCGGQLGSTSSCRTQPCKQFSLNQRIPEVETEQCCRLAAPNKTSANVNRCCRCPECQASFPPQLPSTSFQQPAAATSKVLPKGRREKPAGKMTVRSLKKKTVNALGSGSDSVAPPCFSGPSAGNKTVCTANNRRTRDPGQFMLSTLKSKGRTPDWIAGIFSIARRGNLEKLMQALMDMDATLIRNLSDHRGNNLFHVCCCFGHLECLQWLMQRGKQCEDAILDENKYELTPLVCAVKYGKLPCVEWLISNSMAREQLVLNNGGRPLLHWAAKYGQEVILRWLAQFMENNDMGVNVKDGYGNTALHLAAKHGHAVSIKALVTHRCDVSLKNDLGYKASDYAILYGQTTCSEYLLILEACLILSSDVSSLESDLNCSKTEMGEMKTQFKEVLSCAKKLIKEREELSQHLDQLQDGLVHLNNVLISEIQALCEENKQLRSKATGTLKLTNNHCHSTLDETVALCHAMHTRWQEGQQRWFSPAALSEIQQKILLAEERWKRARARVTWGEKETKDHMNVFRERLSQVQCRTTGIRLSDIRSVSSSESSLASMEEDTLSDYEDRCEVVPSTPRTNPSGCPDCYCTCHEWKFFENHCYQQPPPPPPPLNLNFNSNSHGELASRSKNNLISGNNVNVSTTERHRQETQVRNNNFNANLGSETTCKVLEVIASPANSTTKENLNLKQESLLELMNENHPPWSIVNSSYVEFSAKEEVSCSVKNKVCEVATRKNIKITNNTGDCKSELLLMEKRDDGHNGDDDEDNNRKCNSFQDVRSRICDQQQSSSTDHTSRGVSSKSENKSGTSSSDRRYQENNSAELSNLDRSAASNVKGNASGCGNAGGKLIFSEPDLIIGTKGARTSNSEEIHNSDINNRVIDNANTNENLSVANVLEENNSRSDDVSLATTGEDEEAPLLEVDKNSHKVISESEEPCCSTALSSGGGPLARRKGFLQKLNLRWPSKRTKVSGKSGKKGQEITPEDFRDTYMHLNRSSNGEENSFVEGELNDSNSLLINLETPSIPVKNNKVAPEISKESSNKLPNSISNSIHFKDGGTSSSVVVKQKVNRNSVLTEVEEILKKPNMLVDSPSSVNSVPSLPLPPPLPPCLPPGTTKRDVPIPPVPFEHPEDVLLNEDLSISVNKEESNDICEVDDDDDDKTENDDGIRSPELLDDGDGTQAEDSNSVLQRPVSGGAKSIDLNCSVSRPESSASRSEPTYLAFRHLPGFPLHKVASISTDLLTPDSLTPSRMSPAPSEVSKTESALSPPSDISKTESMRHMKQLTRIEENIGNRDSRPLPALPIRRYDEVKRANIVETVEMQKQTGTHHKQQINAELKVGQEILDNISKEKIASEDLQATNKDKIKMGVNLCKSVNKRPKASKEEKPWYDLSDDEEMMMSDARLRKADMVKGHRSSEDDETYFCT